MNVIVALRPYDVQPPPLQIIQAYISRKYVRRFICLPSQHHLFLLNLDKSPAWLFLSNLLSSRTLCRIRTNFPNDESLLVLRVCGRQRWRTADVFTTLSSLVSSRLCQEFEWVIGHLAWSLRAVIPPLAPSPILSSHPLYLPRFSSSHLLTLFIYTVWFIWRPGQLFISSPLSPPLRVFTHLWYFMSALMRAVNHKSLPVGRRFLSIDLTLNFTTLQNHFEWYAEEICGWTDSFYNPNWLQPTRSWTQTDTP